MYKFKDMTTGKTYAGKVVSKSSIQEPRAKAKLKSEIELHRSLDHANIVEFVSFMEDSKFVYILLGLCSNGSFMELLKQRRQLTEPEVAFYMMQLLDATEYLHDRNIIHRDLKLGNLFIDEGLNVQVGDFGLATSVEHKGERKKTICGTPNYIAPEILDKRNNGHSFEVDIWSIGVILYTMIIGKPPFETSKLKTTYSLIKTNTYSFPPNKPISEAARSLIRSMLQARPSSRPTIAEIKAHRFFTENPIPASLPRCALKRAPLHSELFPVAGAADGVAASSSSSTKLANDAVRTVLGERTTASSAADRYTESLKAKYAGNAKYASGSNAADKAGAVAPASSAASAAVTAASSAKTSSSSRAVDDDYAALSTMHEKLTASFAVMGSASGRSSVPTGSASVATSSGSGSGSGVRTPYYTVSWVDYSSRYGLGAQLSDGTVAVHFNDATKIALSADGQTVQYIERVRSSSGSRDVPQMMTLETYPTELKKKITLLKYFQSYLLEHLDRKPTESDSSSTRASTPGTEFDMPDGESAPTENLMYIKKWLRTKHAIIFRTAGREKIVQVNFYDHTKIILSQEAQVVTYIDKSRNIVSKSLADVMAEQAPDLLNRLKYVKDIIRSWCSSKSKKTTSS